MPTETERKFLLRNDAWRWEAVSCSLIRQAYARLQGKPHLNLRIRLMDEQAYLTLKGPVNGCSRSEFEYPIPTRDAEDILNEFCEAGRIEKYRYRIPAGRHVWEIDQFLGSNAGLVVAEIELAFPEDPFERPEWLGREVTGELRFYNSRLLDYPYRDWKPEERI